MDTPIQNGLLKENKDSSTKWKTTSDEITTTGNATSSNSFDCNICLDFVQEPIVTLCGHLYCWPCIYKWIHFDTISRDPQKQAHCPVCKADISTTTIIPLYGRGQISNPIKRNASHLDLAVPKRPSRPCRTGLPQQIPRQTYHQHESMSNLGYPSRASTYNPIIGMFSEMVYARMFGNSTTDIYNFAGSSSPRVRRYEMQADKSLGRICFFLFCCVFLCLVLF